MSFHTNLVKSSKPSLNLNTPKAPTLKYFPSHSRPSRLLSFPVDPLRLPQSESTTITSVLDINKENKGLGLLDNLLLDMMLENYNDKEVTHAFWNSFRVSL